MKHIRLFGNGLTPYIDEHNDLDRPNVSLVGNMDYVDNFSVRFSFSGSSTYYIETFKLIGMFRPDELLISSISSSSAVESFDVIWLWSLDHSNFSIDNDEDADKCSAIFENLGFKEVRTVIKEREYYKYENYEISLDNVHGLDPYMEIEISLEDDSDYSKAQESIFELFEKLGITDGFERTSYLELLEELDNKD